MPEPAAGRPGVLASLRPRVKVPPRARGTFAVAVPCLQVAWLWLACSCRWGRRWPRRCLPRRTGCGAAWVVFPLAGIGAAATVVFRGLASTAMLAGCLVLLTGVAVTFAAIAAMSAAAFLAGTAVAAWASGWRSWAPSVRSARWPIPVSVLPSSPGSSPSTTLRSASPH